MNESLEERIEAIEYLISQMDSDSGIEDWEWSDAGVQAMQDKIQLYGQTHVDGSIAPHDWAWQLVGVLGCGYCGVTEDGVREALQDERWTTTTFGQLLPTGGAVPRGSSGLSD